MLEIRFLSQNDFKVAEAQKILQGAGVSVVPIASKVEELQTEDSKRLVKDKAIKAKEDSFSEKKELLYELFHRRSEIQRRKVWIPEQQNVSEFF